MSKVTLESVAAEFRSGNSVPVERATLTRERMQEALEAYADAKVREALEAAANEPQAHIRQLEREGWVEEWPDELDLLHTFGGSISKRIRGLIPTGTKEKK